jgi:hypothetical protein
MVLAYLQAFIVVQDRVGANFKIFGIRANIEI